MFPSIKMIERKTLIEYRLLKYINATDRLLEASLACAGFNCAFADAQFLASRMPIDTYTTRILRAYTALDLTNHAQGLCDLAEAMISYNSTVATDAAGNNPPYLAARWSALSIALESFTSASKLDSSENGSVFNLPKIHIKRGDCELLRAQLAPLGYEPAVANMKVLVKNAAKFYVGAEANARNLGLRDEAKEAVFKGALVSAIQGEVGDLSRLMQGDGGTVAKLVEEVVQDGLVSAEELENL